MKRISEFTDHNFLKKIKFLISKITSKSKFFSDKIISNKENKEVWKTFKVLADEPPECLGAYVISMTSKASDILAVSLLQKEAGIKNKLRVVPLFETLDDLKNAKSTMDSLFSIKWYRKYIKNEQEIMIGYSDSNIYLGAIILLVLNIFLYMASIIMLKTGFKLKA